MHAQVGPAGGGGDPVESANFDVEAAIEVCFKAGWVSEWEGVVVWKKNKKKKKKKKRGQR